MADTTVTIAASGADYTTITAALAASDVSSGAYIMQITDTRNYGTLALDDTLNFQATTGTPTQANRLILEADANSRHSGVFELASNNSHAKLMSYYSFSFPYDLTDSYTEFRHMHVGSTTGNDVFRIGSTATDCLFSRCLFYIDNPNFSDSIFYFSPSVFDETYNLYLDNCVFCDVGQLIDFLPATNSVTFNLYVDHCGIETMDNTGVNIFSVNFNIRATVTTNFYLNNSWLEANNVINYETISNGGNAGCSVNYYGAYNVGDVQTPFSDPDSTDNTTNYEYASGDYTDITTVNDAIIVTNDPSPSTRHASNMTPQVATGGGSNALLGYAGNRIGSEPDSRQDFSTDIIGNPRTAKAGFIDVGPFQITAAPAGFKYWNGTAWADSVSVKNWNGTAWVDVTAVKYWNGSTWADPV